jgi:hypothetical protein
MADGRREPVILGRMTYDRHEADRRYERKRYARCRDAGVCSRRRREEVENGVGGMFTKCFNCRTEQSSYDFLRTDRGHGW